MDQIQQILASVIGPFLGFQSQRIDAKHNRKKGKKWNELIPSQSLIQKMAGLCFQRNVSSLPGSKLVAPLWLLSPSMLTQTRTYWRGRKRGVPSRDAMQFSGFWSREFQGLSSLLFGFGIVLVGTMENVYLDDRGTIYVSALSFTPSSLSFSHFLSRLRVSVCYQAQEWIWKAYLCSFPQLRRGGCVKASASQQERRAISLQIRPRPAWEL